MQTDKNRSIRIEADVAGFDESMRLISQSAENFGRIFASSMRTAALSGREFDDTLRSIVQRISNLALSQAFRPLEEMAGRLFSGAFGGNSAGLASGRGAAPTVNFNVNASDAGSFRKSEAQIAALLSRVVARGGRGM